MTEKAKTRGTWAYRAFVVSLLGAIATRVFSFAVDASDALNNRTFDNITQKGDIINLLKQKKVITAEEAERFRSHIEDEDRHMSAEEKRALIIFGETQKRIGQDLDQIKNMQRIIIENQNRQR